MIGSVDGSDECRGELVDTTNAGDGNVAADATPFMTIAAAVATVTDSAAVIVATSLAPDADDSVAADVAAKGEDGKFDLIVAASRALTAVAVEAVAAVATAASSVATMSAASTCKHCGRTSTAEFDNESTVD
jgi:hypothetical protein